MTSQAVTGIELKAQAEEELFGDAKRMARRMGGYFVLNELGRRLVAGRMEEIAARPTPDLGEDERLVDELRHDAENMRLIRADEWADNCELAADRITSLHVDRERMRDALVALADGAEKCSETPHFIVQPFLSIYKRHGETIAKARAALSGIGDEVA